MAASWVIVLNLEGFLLLTFLYIYFFYPVHCSRKVWQVVVMVWYSRIYWFILGAQIVMKQAAPSVIAPRFPCSPAVLFGLFCLDSEHI